MQVRLRRPPDGFKTTSFERRISHPRDFSGDVQSVKDTMEGKVVLTVGPREGDTTYWITEGPNHIRSCWVLKSEVIPAKPTLIINK